MHDLRHILTGTDFSETSKGSVRESLRLASQDPARRVTLVHVASKVTDEAELKARLRQWVEALPEYADLPDPSVQVGVEVEVGRISAALASCAQRVGATQIIVGPLTRNLMERWLTGPIAEQLFHTSDIPVLATRGPATGGYRHVLVPVDFSGHSRRAVAVAAAMLRDPTVAAPDAHLELLHVAELPGGVHAVGARKELVSSLVGDLERQLRTFAAEEGVTDLVAHSRAVIGVVQDVIPREAHGCGADLICMASSSGGGLLGSTVDAVLRNVSLPLLFVSRVPDTNP